MLDFGSEEEARESSPAYEAKAEKWWSSEEVARWNTVYKGPEGWQLCFNLTNPFHGCNHLIYSWLYLWHMTSMLQVQLQQKIKQEAEQFRQWKASREKELLQVCQASFYHVIEFVHATSQWHLEMLDVVKLVFCLKWNNIFAFSCTFLPKIINNHSCYILSLCANYFFRWCDFSIAFLLLLECYMITSHWLHVCKNS